MYKLDSLKEEVTVYDGKFESYGLNIWMRIKYKKPLCSINIQFYGTLTNKDPSVYILQEKYRPYLTHRIKGWIGELLVNTDGRIQIQGAEGYNYEEGTAEIGYSWLCIG